MKKLNCWEFKKCGRQSGGVKVGEFGICPAALEDRADGINEGLHAGRACWAIAGTFCGGRVQGSSAAKLDNCVKCDFYQLVVKEEGLNFQGTKEIIAKITKGVFYIGMPLLLKTENYANVGAHLTGLEGNSCFIVRLPFVDGKPLTINTGEQCSIKFIKDEDAYVFESEVISFQHFPVPLIFFSYPHNVRKMRIRACKRFRVNIPAKVHFIQENIVSEVLITDISETGCKLKSRAQQDADIKEGGSCKLAFSVLNTNIDDIGCSVKNVKSEGNTQFIGVEFHQLRPETKEIIKALTNILRDAS